MSDGFNSTDFLCAAENNEIIFRSTSNQATIFFSVASRRTMPAKGFWLLYEGAHRYEGLPLRRNMISSEMTSLYRFFYRATLCVSAVFAVARCLSVCLSRWWIVSRRLKISSNFFRPGSHDILVFSTPASVPNSKGTHFSGAQNTRGGKILRFSTEIAVHLGNGMR